MNNKGDYTMLT